MKIEIGGVYKRRDGKITAPLIKDPKDDMRLYDTKYNNSYDIVGWRWMVHKSEIDLVEKK